MKIASFNSESGVTLIEVMIALIIIAVIILGGGMFFFYGRVVIIREAHRRAALLVASQRLEELKAANYSKISGSEDEYYIIENKGTEGDWDFVTYATPPPDDAQEPVDVDNLSKGPTGPTMVTEAKWMDDESDGLVDEGSDDSYDYLEIMVMVNWQDSTANSVSLTTLIAPR